MIRETVPGKITIFFVAPLLAFPLKKLRIVALYLLTTFRTLALGGGFFGVSLFHFKNTLNTAGSLQLKANCVDIVSNYQRLEKTRKGTDICERESPVGG